MGRVYASADWHGCSAPVRKLIEYLQPDDTLYFLGDAIDRGPDGVKLLDWLFNDSRVKMLKGNHEYFLQLCAPELLKDDYYPTNSFADDWLYGNGGWKTWEYLIENRTGEEILEYINKISKLPTKTKYSSPVGHEVILEHAGYTPGDIPHRSHDPLWDREHFYDKWNHDDKEYNNIYLVHGHTPVQYLKFMYGYNGQGNITKEELKIKYMWDDPSVNYIPTIIRYCDGHKFDIDMCTISSGRIVLLDLDTFEEIYFDEEIENE